MVMGFGKILPVVVILDSGSIIWLMVMEYMNGKMVIVMKESGINHSDTAMVQIRFKMEIFSLANTFMDKQKVKGLISGLTVIHTLEILKMERSKVKDFGRKTVMVLSNKLIFIMVNIMMI